MVLRKPQDPPPHGQSSRKIQLPYINKFDTIWEYKKSFLSGQIDFLSYLGPVCPICDSLHCYRQITHYWRYAIDLFPEFKKKQVPIARFLCQKRGETLSLLPIQLIPYFQYTVSAVIGTLLFGAELYIIKKDLLFDIEALQHYIAKHKINLLNFVPSLLEELL